MGPVQGESIAPRVNPWNLEVVVKTASDPSCSVGIGGHVLHGGFGMSSYTHGLALDGLTAATVVLANGTSVRASPTSHSDLFWALRGAGSSFGIVSEFEFETFEPPEKLTHFEVQLGWNDTESIVEGWLELQNWAEEMPREMNMRFSVDGRGVGVDGLYHGSRDEMEEIVVPLVEKLGGGEIVNVTYDWMGQLEAYAFADELDLTYPYDLVSCPFRNPTTPAKQSPVPFPLSGPQIRKKGGLKRAQHENFYAKSLTTHALPRSAIEAFADYGLRAASEFIPGPSLNRTWWILVDIHGGANSRISEVPHDSTAYAHRDKLLLFQFYDRVFSGEYPDDEEEGYGLLDGFVESITGELEEGEWGMYVNYADPRVEDVAEEVYFGENVERLRAVKRAVDPEDVFYHPLGITPRSRE